MKKVLFLHGFFASGSCIPALALREAFGTDAVVLTPDLPIHPGPAMQLILKICENEHPDVIVGNSNGAFLAQMAAQHTGIPALLGNPHFEMTRFLSERTGAHRFKSPRADGKQDFIIDDKLIDEFENLQKRQFDVCNKDMEDKVWGLFGDNDTLAHYEPLFLEHYTTSFHFPGNHTPNADEVKRWYYPLAMKLSDNIRDISKC